MATTTTRQSPKTVENGNKLPKQRKAKKMSVNPEQIDDMTMEEVGQALEDASNKKAKEAKSKTKDSDRPEFAFVRSTAHTCFLNELVPLDATPIPNGKYCMREVNKEHAQHLQFAYEAGNHLPPLKVVATTWGYVPYDGYHRWYALESAVAALAGDDKDKLAELRGAFKVHIDVRNNVSERDIVKLAFEANYTNGLPVSNGSRSRYGMWLLEDAKANGTSMTQVEAARIAQVEVHALRMYIKRQADKLGKMAADYVSSTEELEEFEEETAEEEANKTQDKLNLDVKKLINAAKSIFSQVQDTEAFHVFMKSYIDKDATAEALDFIAKSVGRPW